MKTFPRSDLVKRMRCKVITVPVPTPQKVLNHMTLEYTPRHVKSILASHQPPNIAQLESVEWSNTTIAGVYRWVLKPKG